MTSRRYGRWELLGLSEDPVPSDAGDVLDVAKDYRTRANDLGTVRDTLSDLSDLADWTGDAAETFAAHAGDGVEDIGKARDRYDGVADALETYASRVYTARDRTKAALDRAETADTQRSANSHDPLAGVDDPTDAQVTANQQRLNRLSEAQGELDAARSDLQQAMDDLRSAASTCADDIKEAASHFKDGWFDNFKGFIRDHADLIKAVVEVLKWVAAVVAVITLVVIMFVTAPAWLVAGLIALGVALAAAILLLDSALLTVGEATWGDVAWDAVGLALSLVGGKATTALMERLTAKMGPAVTNVLAQVARDAESTTPRLLRWMQSSGFRPLTWIGDGLAQGRITSIVDDATRTLDHVTPGLLNTFKALDRDLATSMSKIDAMRRLVGDTSELGDLTHIVNQIRGITGVMTINDLDGVLDRFSPVSINSLAGGAIDGTIEEIHQLSWRLHHLG